MAVYTQVNDDDLAAFLDRYDLGAALSLKGIAEGVENSNFLLDTEKGRFILTLYEKRVRPGDLPFFLDLMKFLAASGLPCAEPQSMTDGALSGRLAGRPAAIIGFLDGLAVSHPTPDHARAVGAALGVLHKTGLGFKGTRENTMGHGHWAELAARIGPRADTVTVGLNALIADELAYQSADWPEGLPAGIIHADLFPDNVLFTRGVLTGLIDFYFACTDLFAYDLSVCLNSWCFDDDVRFRADISEALIAGYQAERRLETAEIKALPRLCRASALRFLLTRTLDWLEPVKGALVAPKDPADYIKRLKFHQAVADASAYAGL